MVKNIEIIAFIVTAWKYSEEDASDKFSVAINAKIS
jgi:hypothetical protein